jgi:hypothetical protein
LKIPNHYTKNLPGKNDPDYLAIPSVVKRLEHFMTLTPEVEKELLLNFFVDPQLDQELL